MIERGIGGIVFVAGLAIGPILGLLMGDAVFRSEPVQPRYAMAALLVVGVVFLLVPAINLELKLGLLAGVPLGILLSCTPITGRQAEEDGLL